MNLTPSRLEPVSRRLKRNRPSAFKLVSNDRMITVQNFSDIKSIRSHSDSLLQRGLSNPHVQNILDGKRLESVPDDFSPIARYYEDHAFGKNNSKRQDIIGHQRATIYYSTLSASELARAHHCSVKTIYRIKSDPLSSCGMTHRIVKSFICDLIDTYKADYYSNTSRIPFVLPNLPDTPRPGPSSSISPFEREILRCLLTHHPDLYLDQILSFLCFLDPSKISSISSISRTLQRMKMTLKIPNRVLSRADHNESKIFQNMFKMIGFYPSQLVFLDESANSRALGIVRKARAPHGITPVSQSRHVGERLTCVCAITIFGIFHSTLISGSLVNDDFHSILNENIFPEMNSFPNPFSVLILDNCRAHQLDIDEIWEKHSILVLYLPPYSPHLNPIERLFACLKAHIKRLVYNAAGSKQSPKDLWIQSLRYCQTHFDFHRVIINTYQVDEMTGKINIRI